MNAEERQIWVWVLAAIAYVSVRIMEYRRHHENMDFLEFAGAEEGYSGIHRAYVTLTWAPIVLVPLEWLVWGAETTDRWQIAACLLALAVSTVLRFWSIHAIGRLWSLRCIWVAGISFQPQGPARLLRNPEYLTRVADVLVLCLLGGATVVPWVLVPMIGGLGMVISHLEKKFAFEINGGKSIVEFEV